MNWYLDAVKNKYAVFDGRAQRQEFWYFMLFYLLIYFALSVIDQVTGAFNEQTGTGLFSGIYTLAMLIPSLAVGARRLHDTGRSGWWQLLSLIPVLGILVLIFFFAQDSQPGANQYGPNPKSGQQPL
ncbi:DUF805 domain-containing protein [Methylobacter sp. YRD-M1]|uniref:DUF805 domain-containing protein n=1 Tax=Methylobacter sp. YRD-M1 TaxID=2911520 RepID=UPI00227A5924|nr:DUF805 domain-containing protein [Methylobacter sp. YRD-M1]WAK00480.1 DUF805 domain-containing protein [Methylobacter sp. YRD-M1]